MGLCKRSYDTFLRLECQRTPDTLFSLKSVNELVIHNRYALKNTNAIEFHLYDKDDDQKYLSNIEEVNSRKDGSFGMLTRKREIENYIPKSIIEKEFDINIDLAKTENWDEVNIPVKVRELKNQLKESDIKSIICGKLSKTITKSDFDSLNAWDEVKSWFEKINELVGKVN